MKKRIYIILLICLLGIAVISMCKTGTIEEKHSSGDECRHCHGEQLQGIQNIKDSCSECHEKLNMKPGEIQVKERKEAVLNGPHPHKTDNVFKSTPSCFFCHRRTDF